MHFSYTRVVYSSYLHAASLAGSAQRRPAASQRGGIMRERPQSRQSAVKADRARSVEIDTIQEESISMHLLGFLHC